MNGRNGSAREPVLTICGGGNAGHALAVVASQNFDGEVNWLVRTDAKAELLRSGLATDGLRSTGVITGRADRVRTISADPAEVIPSADIVIIVVPAFAHRVILEQIGPHLSDSAMVGCLPTRGGFEFDACRYISGLDGLGSRVVFGLQTLPWSTRVVDPGRVVNFGAHKAAVLMATLPNHHGPATASRISSLLDTPLMAADGFLNMTLGNPGQFIHPGLMYGAFSEWDGRAYAADEIPYFYSGATDAMGDLVNELSLDAIAVARRLEELSDGRFDLSGVLSIHEWLKLSYPTQTADTTTVGSCFRTGPIQARKAPMREVEPGRFVPDFAYRYLTEDVPYGLVVTRAVAELAGVATPAIDTVLHWAQENMGESYLVNGRLDVGGTSALPVPQAHGIESAPAMLDWYGRRSRAVAAPVHG